MFWSHQFQLCYRVEYSNLILISIDCVCKDAAISLTKNDVIFCKSYNLIGLSESMAELTKKNKSYQQPRSD